MRRLGLDEETSTSTLAEILEVQKTDAQALYTAMDWLGERQAEIEEKLANGIWKTARCALREPTYFEGKCCPLGQLGHSRTEEAGTLPDRLWPLMQPSGMSGGRGSV